MGKEIEKKFLVKNEGFKKNATHKLIRQGFLNKDPEIVVRIRVADDKAWLTIKGRNKGSSRDEFEYEIPKSDAVELLKLCEKPLIEKTRYYCTVKEKSWEIDVFTGENEGLILAEVELSDEMEQIEIPDWAGTEVTNDPRYYNNNLVLNPFQRWDTND